MSEARGVRREAETPAPVIACRGLHKIFYQGAVEVPVLTGVDLDVAVGERVAIVGASGSGKSTLLHLLGGLDEATRGEVRVQGQELSRQSETERGHTRNRALGFVYQFHHLLPEFSAIENVAMPLLIRRLEERCLRPGEAAAHAGRPRTPADASSGRAVGRRAPARGAGARAGDETGVHTGRRAHRQPRPAQRGGGVRPHARSQPRDRHQPCDRHARHGPGAARGPRAAPAGRSPPGARMKAEG